MDDNNQPIDVSFEEYIPTKYYSCPDAAQIIEVPESTIRYWCAKYKNFLNVKTSGRNRQFTDENINILKQIKDLRMNKNYTGEQTYEYLKKLYDSNSLEIINEIPQNDKEVFIDAIANTLTIKMNKSLELITNQISVINNDITKQNKLLTTNQNELKHYINQNIEQKMNKIANEFNIKQDKIIKLLEKNIENQEKLEKKSLFSRIFHKK